MNIRYATAEDQEFINQLCQLSYTKQDQWIGYPRVSDLSELLAEYIDSSGYVKCQPLC
ncbi:hypothetical protein ACFFJI_00070 [Allobacillus sp. GCM10007491]|uniref:Uncharacterized protein n=1 Tax=Allobacillus saliphilus TaxID=2912308 RepID=A0A941HTZ6_9BACI|nr:MULTISPECIES: hypothetical protein [Allobacillus]MBR7554903.1 hypothetical protein [Allobacillus saliphilus]